MTREQEINILIKDGETKQNAIRYIEHGTAIFEENELKKYLEMYLDEWEIEEEDRKEYRKMLKTKKPMKDWGVVKDDETYYFIEYAL